ncbi:MAG: hypothetical protein ACK56N_04770, partial [Betaproteobacteria bacterium]
MKTQIWKAALLGGAIALSAPVQAQNEVAELKMMSQYGIGYMQLTVVKAEKMIEKHLAKAGLPNTKVTWATLGAGAAANDALLQSHERRPSVLHDGHDGCLQPRTCDIQSCPDLSKSPRLTQRLTGPYSAAATLATA